MRYLLMVALLFLFVACAGDGAAKFTVTPTGTATATPTATPESTPTRILPTPTAMPWPSCPLHTVNINRAPLEELMQIQHIGEERALEIIARRPFASVENLLDIPGIASGRLADIKEQDLACAGPP